jgi:hypothetical protein
MCDKEVSIDENYNAAKLQKPDKSPGDDGISSEFYKLFWYLIGDDFVSVVKDIFRDKRLCESQYRDIIFFLLKKLVIHDQGYVPFVVMTIQYFPNVLLITRFVIKATRWVPLVRYELVTLAHLHISPVFRRVCVSQSLVFCVMFIRSLFVFFWPLSCLFLFPLCNFQTLFSYS